MSRRKPLHNNQLTLMPELLKDRVENRPHPAKFFLYIANILYLPFYKTSHEGTPPYDRVTLVALILYGFYKSNFSAEAILEMAQDDLGAIWILRKMSLPSSKTIDRVIKAIMENIELIFMQIIKLCEAFNLIGKERAFVDGTKTKANASKHKAMSYEYLCNKIENNNNTIHDLIEEVIDKINLDDFENPDNEQLEKQILTEAQEIYKTAESLHQQQLKANQEAIFSGKKPEATDDRTTSLHSVPEGQTTIFEHIDPENEKKINEIMYDIGIKDSRQQNMEKAKDELEECWQEENGNKTIPDKEQINFTDPESSIMITKHNGVQQCYNNFAVVDDKAYVIVGTYTTNSTNDKQALIPTIEDAQQYIGPFAGIIVGADTGFYSASNIKYGMENDIDLYISEPEAESDYAKDKFEYDKENDVYICPEGEVLKPPARMHEDAKTHAYKTSACLHCPSQNNCTRAKDGIRKIIRHMEKDELRELASKKAATDLGKEVLSQRKSVSEPVWGNMQNRDGLIQLHYRGLDKAGKEFKLRCVMHDLRKLLKVFVNNSQARDEITHMGEYPSQAAV